MGHDSPHSFTHGNLAEQSNNQHSKNPSTLQAECQNIHGRFASPTNSPLLDPLAALLPNPRSLFIKVRSPTTFPAGMCKNPERQTRVSINRLESRWATLGQREVWLQTKGTKTSETRLQSLGAKLLTPGLRTFGRLHKEPFGAGDGGGRGDCPECWRGCTTGFGG